MTTLTALTKNAPAALMLAEGIDKDSEPEVVLEMVARLEALAALAREFGKQVQAAKDEAFERWDNGEKKSVQTEDKRWYYGTKTVKKMTASPLAVLDAILTAFDGDLNRAAECISGAKTDGAFKAAEVKKAVGDEKFAELFSVEKAKKLTDGKPIKKLRTIPLNLPGVG